MLVSLVQLNTPNPQSHTGINDIFGAHAFFITGEGIYEDAIEPTIT